MVTDPAHDFPGVAMHATNHTTVSFESTAAPGLTGAQPGLIEQSAGNALRQVETTFNLLVRGPVPLALDGAAIGRGLPARTVRLDEVRALLLARPASDLEAAPLKDAVWRELVHRARTAGPAWVVGCFGVAMPSLKRIAARAVLGLRAEHAEDVVAELVAAFCEALSTVDVHRKSIALRLSWTAHRAAARARCRADQIADRETPLAPEHAPAVPSTVPGSDDGQGAARVLAEAVRTGVLTQSQADLITVTRLGGLSVNELARKLGITAKALYRRRDRAEQRLVTALRDGQLSANFDGPAGKTGR
ncbi:RNA polymerase sigma factor [Spirillospora sp. NPDC127200]